MPATIEEEIKQRKGFANNKQKAYVNLIYTANTLADRFRCMFEKYDITQQQFNVLRILNGSDPEPLFCNQIKDVMLDKNPDVTRLCDRLAAKNLIARHLNTRNRRKMNITITEEGKQLLGQIEPGMMAHMSSMGQLTEEEAETLSALLDKFRG